ncbi:site-specific integrase [Myroides odoratimimus]|uniref:site-specific integrase n=1 Tax=Myroides TaxID=76831 RepID=UPI0015FCE28D|nr:MULTISPECIES: site-specific integrase [Myroides]MBB1149694.1 site-specific integrase [Myroides sp. NP-2]MDM1537651.1 site-specific integrase [Myroides odoratimimus]MDM1677210.1 site-specific integrase [Myroides odoratimimus]MEC4077544.1 site-specific integrase [Myroides odoratimimus]
MKVLLRERLLPSGKINLSIEYYKGTILQPNGKRKTVRDYENLKLFLHGEPKNASERKENKETMALAKQILAIREAEVYQGRYELKNSTKGKKPFLDYFQEKTEEKSDSPKNYGNWTATLIHLKRCISPNTIFDDIDEKFIKRVRTYFDKEARTKSDLPLSLNSKYSYFNKFKACLRAAFDEGYLALNYAAKIKSFEQAESQREYLTFNEVQQLANTECKYEVLKRAFLFSCLTGLRWSDIHNMTWSEVRDEDDSSRVNFRQEKTDGVEYLYISTQARELLGERKGNRDRVFIGLRYSAVYNNAIVLWCNKAGISKHITFHSARHTNAVLLLENGADIYTVSKRLGHREIRTTAIYAKIVDEKMKEASNLIPELSF